jgi:hypothetical protein
MFNKIAITTILVSGISLSGASQAAEVSVEQYLGSLVSHAVNVTKQEISYGVQKAILTANHTISTDSEAELYATNVTITDLNSEATATNKDNDKSD